MIERFEKAAAHLDLSRSTIDGRYRSAETRQACDLWWECEQQCHPPKPVNLPTGWRVKGEEQVMVRAGELYPPWFLLCGNVCQGGGIDAGGAKMIITNTADFPIFVWQLERVEVAT